MGTRDIGEGPAKDRSLALERLVRRVEGVLDHTLHPAVVHGFLGEGTPADVVEALRELMASLDRPGYRQCYQAVVHFFLRGADVPYKRLEELYRTTVAQGYGPIRWLLLRTPPLVVAGEGEVLPDPEILDIPLGRRKSMARSLERVLLLRLAMDPTPPVVEILLGNPRLVEQDVVRIAARRPNVAAVIEVVAAHPRWSLRYDVQHSIVQNPYSPASLAAALVPFMRGSHLQEIAGDNTLHEAVRESAKTVGEWRAEMRGAPGAQRTLH